jgi:hypothetical protein
MQEDSLLTQHLSRLVDPGYTTELLKLNKNL